MRQLVTLLFFVFSINYTHAQSKSSTKNLELAVQQFDQSKTRQEYEWVFAKMQDLYQQNNQEWLPAYYASIIKARMAMEKMGNADKLADEAIRWLNITKALHYSDEVLCLESLVFTSKMSVNPTFRWLAYESKIKLPLEKAIALNKNNPRAYLLQANIQYKIPSLLGGGCEKAIPMIQKARVIFEAQKEEFTIMPHWGRPLLASMIKACALH